MFTRFLNESDTICQLNVTNPIESDPNFKFLLWIISFYFSMPAEVDICQMSDRNNIRQFVIYWCTTNTSTNAENKHGEKKISKNVLSSIGGIIYCGVAILYRCSKIVI